MSAEKNKRIRLTIETMEGRKVVDRQRVQGDLVEMRWGSAPLQVQALGGWRRFERNPIQTLSITYSTPPEKKKREWPKGYKIFTKRGRRLYPYVMDDLFNPYPVADGTWVQRADGCGPFSVFETIEDLDRQFPGRCDGVVYLVEYRPSRAKRVWMGKEVYEDTLPEGTVLADEFRLLEEVDVENLLLERWDDI